MILILWPIWIEVEFKDATNSRLELAGTLRLGPTVLVDAEVGVIVVVLIDVLVIVLVVELVIVLVCGGDRLANIVTVEVNGNVAV